jgi:hypothetical protein
VHHPNVAEEPVELEEDNQIINYERMFIAEILP